MNVETHEKYGKLRKHQWRAIQLVRMILEGVIGKKFLTFGITPGGGKTLLSAVFTAELADAGLIDRVLFVTANDALRTQVKEGFHDHRRGLHRTLVDNVRQRSLLANESPFGIATTYQMARSPRHTKRLVRWCAEGKTLVVFDEGHHMTDHSDWGRAARALAEASEFVVVMSGTLLRHDEMRIPLVDYDGQGKAVIDVPYTRREALSEGACLPFSFLFSDGRVVYRRGAQEHDTRLSGATYKESARALKVALEDPEFSTGFIAAALDKWESYRDGSAYPSSKAIVVCHREKEARRAIAFIRQRYGRHNPVLSIGADDAVADKAIADFRNGKHSILVTIRKAYEGLDVPSATHLVYLGDSRSWPFLDQVFARVSRFNGGCGIGYDSQAAHVYVPNDRMMRDYVDHMLDEQEPYFREREERESKNGTMPRGPRVIGTASLGDEIPGWDGHVCTPAEVSALDALRAQLPSITGRTEHLLAIARSMGLVRGETNAAE